MEFKNEEILYKPASLWIRGLIWAIVGSFSFGFIYACFARMDEVVIAKGELQALGAERPIRAPISGIVDEIFIKEGDSVEKNSKLLRFDNNVLLAKKEGLEAKLEELESSIKSETEILEEISILADAGGIQKLQYLQQKNKVSELGFEKKQVEAQIKEINFDKSKTLLVSPVKGKVFNLISVSEGFAANQGETLLKIVPSGDTEAKIFLKNSDIGFVKNNMKAKIRVDAFPFTQFGSIEGILKSIGDEVIRSNQQNQSSLFPAYVSLEKQYLEKNGEKFFVRSGQSVSVNLIVRDKRIISLLTDAIDKAIDSLRGIKS
jgi:HlyD family secretion protein